MDVLRQVYKGVPSGFTAEVAAEEEAATATLYGELTSTGIRQLYSLILEECGRLVSDPSSSVHSLSPNSNEAVVTESCDQQGSDRRSVLAADFVDLGSGGGRVCIELALHAAAVASQQPDCAVQGNQLCTHLHRQLHDRSTPPTVFSSTPTSAALSHPTCFKPSSVSTASDNVHVFADKDQRSQLSADGVSWSSVRPILRLCTVSGIEYCKGRWESSHLALRQLSGMVGGKDGTVEAQQQHDYSSSASTEEEEKTIKAAEKTENTNHSTDNEHRHKCGTWGNSFLSWLPCRVEFHHGDLLCAPRLLHRPCCVPPSGEPPYSSSCRPLVFFCCGVAFDIPFITRMCDMVDAMRAGVMRVMPGGDDHTSPPSPRPVIGIFLLKDIPKDHSLFRNYVADEEEKKQKDRRREGDEEGAGVEETTKVHCGVDSDAHSDQHIIDCPTSASVQTANCSIACGDYRVRRDVLECTWMNQHPVWIITHK